MKMSKMLPSAAAGMFCACTALWPAWPAQDSLIPNFSPDSVTGWIAGVPDGENPTGQDFLPPQSGPGPVANDKAHPHVDDGAARRDGKQPTFRVADLTNPILQPWVRDALRKANERALSGKPDFTPKERCWPIGVPGWLLYPVRPVWFLQTPREVTMIWEEDHMVRHVYLNVRHSPNVKPSWFGESIGHYENGDTLVVDTIGLSTKNSYIDNFRTPHTDKLHVVERFTVSADGKNLTAVATVEDPDTFNGPLTMQQRWFKVNDPMAETVCAENNDDFFHQNLFPLPEAKTADF